MSKQESYHPDGNEITGTKSPAKREKGEWELWERPKRKFDHRKIYNYRTKSYRWGKRRPWRCVGSWQTKELAEVNHQKHIRDCGGIFACRYNFVIVGPGDPKPDEK